MDRSERWNVVVATTVALTVPLCVGLLLLRIPVAGSWRISGHADDVLEVRFIRRNAPVAVLPRQRNSATPVAPGIASTRRSQEVELRDDAPVSASASTSTASTAQAARPLDLSVRLPPVDPRATATAPEDRPWLHRDRALDPRTTRFERSWVRAGNALEQAGFRSAAVGVALGAFGGPPKRCTEVERRLREINCLPLDADEGLPDL